MPHRSNLATIASGHYRDRRRALPAWLPPCTADAAHTCAGCFKPLADLTVDLCRRCAGETCVECSAPLVDGDPEVRCWPCWHVLFGADEASIRRGELAKDEGWAL